MNAITAYHIFRDQFRKAMDPAFYTIEYLDALLASGQAWIMAEPGSAIVIEIKDFPGGARVVHGLVAAGDMDGIKRLIAMAEQWGRANGCTKALIESRPGWARALRDVGYQPFQVSIVKDI